MSPAALRHALGERLLARTRLAPRPQAAPIHLTGRRIYVLPTRAGALFAASLVVMLIGAINYTLALGYALVFLLAGLGLVTILHSFRNLAGLNLTVGIPSPVFAGETAYFPVYLGETSGRARRQIRLTVAGGAAQAVAVPAGGRVCVPLAVPAPRRGHLSLPRIRIDTVWPLGWVRAWAYAWPAAQCLVYPRPAQAVPPAPTFGATASGRLPGESGEDDFAGLRPHQPGDSPRHIAWKAAARQGPAAPLATKQFAGTAAPSVWFDWHQLPTGMADETRLAVLTRWILDAEAAGLAYGLRLPGQAIAPNRAAAHLAACLTALALYER